MTRALLLLAALSLAACATTPSGNNQNSAAKPMEEKEYRVGSRIPVRDAVSASPTTSLDASAITNIPSRPN